MSHTQGSEKTVGRVTREQMKAICPSCYDDMVKRGVKRTAIKAKDVQTVLFDKDKWTVEEAKEWLKKYEMSHGKLDEGAEDEMMRFRQFDPDECSDGFATLTEDMPDGVQMVVCKRDEAKAAKKEESLDERSSRIRNSFYDQHEKPMEIPSSHEYIREVFDDHVIVDAGENGLFEVGYSEDIDGAIVFESREKWQKVELEYIPVKADSDMLFAFGGSVKMTDDGHLQGHLITFGTADTPDDSVMKDFFTAKTDYGFGEKTSIRSPLYFHHALPLKAGRSRKIVRYAEKMGEATLTLDEEGVFIDAVLTNTKYKKWIESVTPLLGWSSGTAGHLVERKSAANGTHEVTRWPLGLDASLTPNPADVRNRAILTVKSIIEDEIDFDLDDATGGDNTGEPARAGVVPNTDVQVRVKRTIKSILEDLKVKPEEIQAIADAVKTSLDAEAQAKANKEAADKAAKEAAEAQIKAAVEQIVAEKLTALKGGKIVNAGGKVEGKSANLNLKTGLGDDAFKAFAYYVKTNDATPIHTGDAYEEWIRQREFEMKTDYPLLESTQYQGQEAVPTEVLKVIVEKRDPISIIRAAGATIYPANSNAAIIPIEKATAQVFGITSVNASNTFTTQTVQPLDKLTATVYLFTYNVPIDIQLIDDSVFNIDGWLSRRIGRGWGKTENKYGLVGTGSGQPGGAITGSTLGVTAASATAVTGQEIVDHYYKLPGEYRDNAVWVMRGATEGAVRKLGAPQYGFAFVGTGGYHGGVGQGEGVNAAPVGTGWLVHTKAPVYNSDEVDALAASKKPILLGNFEAGYAIAERKMLTVLRDPFSSADKGLVQLWFYVREGMGVVNADALYHLLTPSA